MLEDGFVGFSQFFLNFWAQACIILKAGDLVVVISFELVACHMLGLVKFEFNLKEDVELSNLIR